MLLKIEERILFDFNYLNSSLTLDGQVVNRCVAYIKIIFKNI